MRIVVYTYLIGDRSEIKAPAKVYGNCEYLSFTTADSPEPPAPWQQVIVDPQTDNPVRESKRIKILSHDYISDADYTISHDASFTLAMDPEVLIRHTGDSPISMHRHPCRNCLYQEADILLREGIGDPAEIERQIREYRALGIPEGLGLHACGLIVRDHRSERVRSLELAWWKAFERGCERDQVSLPYARYITGLRVAPLPWPNVYESPAFIYHGHRRADQ